MDGVFYFGCILEIVTNWLERLMRERYFKDFELILLF